MHECTGIVLCIESVYMQWSKETIIQLSDVISKYMHIANTETNFMVCMHAVVLSNNSPKMQSDSVEVNLYTSWNLYVRFIHFLINIMPIRIIH